MLKKYFWEEAEVRNKIKCFPPVKKEHHFSQCNTLILRLISQWLFDLLITGLCHLTCSFIKAAFLCLPTIHYYFYLDNYLI